ncbi:MAG: hypothetical protein HYU39_01855 [Thaumarchaeota archaeon]|nr:hypothetical protein [Nitrososphaerota archaeon]
MPPIHCSHLFFADPFRALAWGRGEGVEIEAEVTPHHLALSKTDKAPIPLKFTPPVRSKEDCEDLWNALRTGMISCVGSDHQGGRKKAELPKADDT